MLDALLPVAVGVAVGLPLAAAIVAFGLRANRRETRAAERRGFEVIDPREPPP